ncbi:hypothetical protein B0H19DRAFT_1068980 [Mycena capillaripes]|nr:hypothetical protein B0H19DRAFT_1068980 [Mycena capillaripes]
MREAEELRTAIATDSFGPGAGARWWITKGTKVNTSPSLRLWKTMGPGAWLADAWIRAGRPAVEGSGLDSNQSKSSKIEDKQRSACHTSSSAPSPASQSFTVMHPALEFGNVERLPIALQLTASSMPWQKDAVPAYNGSLEHLKRLVTSLDGLQIAKDHSYLLIPVFHANLRTLDSVPVAEATLALESFDDILRATASMEGLVLSSGFAEGLLVEIWPRFWHSFQVVYNHRTSVTTRSEKQILQTLLGFLGLLYDDHGHSFDVVSEVPRLRFFVARAWSLYLRQELHVDRIADDGGFEVITLFLRFSRPKNYSSNSIDELQEFSDGAGGISALSRLVIRHIDFFSHGRKGPVQCLFAAVTFVHRIDPGHGPFHSELLSHGLLKSAVRALTSVQEASLPAVTNLIPPYIFLIASVLNTFPIHPWVKRGAAAGMLPVFIRCCMRRDASHYKETLVEFLTLLASSTVYRSVLRPLQDSVENLREIADSAHFRQSVIIHEWTRFVKLLHSRFMLMCQPESRQVVARNACDNMELTESSVEQSGIEFLSSAVPHARASITAHAIVNVMIGRKGTIGGNVNDTLQQFSDDILSQQKIIQQTHPGLQQSVIFNCNRLEVVVQVHPVRNNTADNPPGLVDILSRASRSHGGMELHALLIDEGLPGGVRKRLISMRSYRSQIREIANSFARTSSPDTEERRGFGDQGEGFEELGILYQ